MTPTVSISDVVPGCMAAADEVLVELVGDRVEPAGEDRDGGPLDRAHEEGAEDRVLAQVRDLAQDQVPGAEARRTGSESTRTRRSPPPRRRSEPTPGSLWPTRSDDRLMPSQGSAVREPGAIPGRSRRCKGSCSPAETPLAHRETGCREGGGRGSPESEDLPPPPYRTPRGRRIRGTTFDRSRDRSRSRSCARRYGSRRHRHGARRRKDPADLRIGARQGGGAERARRARRGEHAGRVLFRAHAAARSATYVSQIGRYPGAGSAGWVFKVNGASPPVGADQVVLKDGDEVLWYYATFGADRAARRRSRSRPRRRTATRSRPSTTPASRRRPPVPRCRSTAGRSRRQPNGRACVGKHVGLVRAYAVGAVRSNAVK